MHGNNGSGEQHSPRSPKSSASPRGGGGGGGAAKLPSSAAAWLVDSRWALSAALSLLLFLAVALAVTSFSSSSSPYIVSPSSFFSSLPVPVPASRAAGANHSQSSQPPPPPGAGVPRLAYLISGSKGDLDRLWRALHALYHPRNQYVVHLDREAPVAERLELAARVANATVFRRAGNVHVIRRANMVTYRGPTMVSNTLHACAVLLRRGGAWDWFINLSASDYPLMTQDGTCAHRFSLFFLFNNVTTPRLVRARAA
jgi:hypothetical protein